VPSEKQLCCAGRLAILEGGNQKGGWKYSEKQVQEGEKAMQGDMEGAYFPSKNRSTGQLRGEKERKR